MLLNSDVSKSTLSPVVHGDIVYHKKLNICYEKILMVTLSISVCTKGGIQFLEDV